MQTVFDVAHIYLSKRTNKKLYSLIKANKKCFSEQIKLDTFWNDLWKTRLPSSPKSQWCFYAEKITLHWIAFAVMTFIWVASTYPDEANLKSIATSQIHSSSCTGILTCFLFNQQKYININDISSYWPFRTGFKIGSLLAKYDCQETLPLSGGQGFHLTICYYHQDLY